MTNQIETIMALADDYMTQERKGANGYEARQALKQALEAALKPLGPETVSVFGVKPNGEVVDTGVKTTMPPRMKAKELVSEMYGRTWEEDDGSEADMCFAVCEQFLDWLIAQGWHVAPPAQTPPRLSDMDLHEILSGKGWAENDYDDWGYERAIETAVRRQFGVMK